MNKISNESKSSREIDWCLQILQQQPNSVDTLSKLAMIYEETKELDKAVDYYNRILKLHPEDSDLNLKIASLKVRQKKFADAFLNYQTALKIQPNQPAWVFIGLGDALNNTQRTKEAILAFRKAVELKPGYGLVYAKLASALVNDGEEAKAIDCYTKAVELQKKLPLWAYISFIKLLRKNNLLEKVVETCHTAETIYPKNNEIKIILADGQSRLGNCMNAINSYYRAIELSSQQPAWVYQNLGDLLFENEQYELAIEKYLASYEINQNSFHSYPQLDISLSEIYPTQHYEISDSINLLSQKYQTNLSALSSYFNLGFLGECGETIDPLNYYFINHDIKLLYCSIPKNACTLFKNIIVEYSDKKAEYEQSSLNIHQFLVSDRGDVSTLLLTIDSPDYLKLVVLRNPFSRLASAYLDKIAKHPNPESFAVDVIKEVQQFQGEKFDLQKSITFEQFIDYLSRKQDYELNDHWRPQNNFVGSVKFDLIGQFENLNLVIDSLQSRYNIRIKKKGAKHATHYEEFNELLSFHTMYPEELRNLPGMPKAGQLYSAKLEEAVRQRYAKDIALYENTFDVSLDSLDNSL